LSKKSGERNAFQIKANKNTNPIINLAFFVRRILSFFKAEIKIAKHHINKR